MRMAKAIKVLVDGDVKVGQLGVVVERKRALRRPERVFAPVVTKTVLYNRPRVKGELGIDNNAHLRALGVYKVVGVERLGTVARVVPATEEEARAWVEGFGYDLDEVIA